MNVFAIIVVLFLGVVIWQHFSKLKFSKRKRNKYKADMHEKLSDSTEVKKKKPKKRIDKKDKI